MRTTIAHMIALTAVLSGAQLSLFAQSVPSLKTAFKNNFLIGTALNARQLAGRDTATSAFIAYQFNTATPEDILKAERVHPGWNRYTFEQADKLVEFGRKYNLAINGHTLIWHSQLPPFVNRIQSPDSLRRFFTDHIQTVAGRYKGSIVSWDVVNEALNEDGTLRESIFLKQLGERYIADAFHLTQQVAPNAELYYNDYNIEQPAKRAGCIALLKTVQASGARIDGVGIQGHWIMGRVPLQAIEASIEQYAALGLKVMITELDLEVLPRTYQGADVSQRMESTAQSNPFANGLPDTVQRQLAADYEALFRLFLKHKDKISRVTFWGVNDGSSWLNNWPVRGRTNYPLLFDRRNQPKPAFYEVVKLTR